MGSFSRLDTAERTISEPEDMSRETSRMEKQREMRQKNNHKQTLHRMSKDCRQLQKMTRMCDGKTGGEARQNPPELFGA